MAINSTAKKGFPQPGKNLVTYEERQMKVGNAVKKNPLPAKGQVKGGK
jgi:hypothetical protein